MRRYVLIISTLFLASCVTPTVSEYSGPSGEKIRSVKCNVDAQKCYESASVSCNGGSYQVLSSSSHAGGLVADILPGPVTWYNMSYICGPSDGRLPDFNFQGQQYVPLAPAPSAPVIVKQPKTTTCHTVGKTVICNTF